MIITDFKSFLGLNVLLTTIRGSKYRGIVNGIREEQRKLHLTWLIILTKDGQFKALSKNMKKNKRWFNWDSIRTIEIAKEISNT